MYKRKFKDIDLNQNILHYTIKILKQYQYPKAIPFLQLYILLSKLKTLENNLILICILGSDFRQRILTSVSDQPVITIPRPGGPRKTSPGKNQSSDGNTMSNS